MSRYLIINADDFGYNPEQTRAIDELYSEGLISSTSLMSVAPDAKAAAEIANRKNYPVGIHLTLNSDSETSRWQSQSGAKSLSDGRGLYSDQLGLALHLRRKDVAAELEAQYKFAENAGCVIDHADNHSATMYGINGRRFYIDAYDFCQRHFLPYRYPKSADFIERQLGRKVPSPIMMLHRKMVNEGLKRNIVLLDDLVFNPWNMQRIGNKDVLLKYYLDAVENCREGVTEIFLHPSYPLDNTEAQGEWTKRIFEFEILKSGALLEKAKKENVKVISWSQIKEYASDRSAD